MIKVFACGDVVNYENQTGILCGDKLSNIIKNADYSICNFEAPIQGYGVAIPKCGPHLHQNKNTLKGLKAQGFNLVLLANNHIMDYGYRGLEATIDAAQEAGLDVLGAGQDFKAAYEPVIKIIAGVKIGILNACEAQFGVIDHFERAESAGYAWINHPYIDNTILKLRKSCDFVLIFVHAGLENYQIPQKEWRARYKQLCDLGADAVVGSHPHVPQGYERHGNSLIFYSLGNFYFDYGYAVESENHSYAVMLELEKGEPPRFYPLEHATRNGQVDLCDSSFNLMQLSEKLGDGYIAEHEKMSLEAYRSIKRNLISSATCLPFDGTFKGTLREMAATLLGRRASARRNLTQLHYVRNETYHYAAKHALELLSRENDDK
jgi:hypothetical protein